MSDSRFSEDRVAPAAAPGKAGLAAFFERRALVMLALGFSSGLPYFLIFDTLSAWLRTSGVSLATIGLFGLVTSTYSLKFVWAPLVDRLSIPGLTRVLGHRRSWMLVTQALVVLGLLAVATSAPPAGLPIMALFVVLVGLAGATQDIVIDAWRIEAAETERQGVFAAAYQWGYRIATIIAGAAPLLLAQTFSWNLSYVAMAAMMAVGVAGVLFAPRETARVKRPWPGAELQARPAQEVLEWLLRAAVLIVAVMLFGVGLSGKADFVTGPLALIGIDAGGLNGAVAATGGVGAFVQFVFVIGGLSLLALACSPFPGLRSRPGAYLGGMFGAPLADFFRRFGTSTGAMILALICVYRLADFVLNIMNPFYIDLGFSLTEIAEVRKVFGVAASLLGITIGAWSVLRLGMIRSLVIGAFASPLAHLGFAWLAVEGHHMPALFVSIGIENVAAGYAGTALIAYMSSLTSAGFTATQYALFSSLYALPGRLIASQSGRIVEGSAHTAETGWLGGLRPLFANLTPESYVNGARTAGVTPLNLGVGYLAFFLYSIVIGVFAIGLAFVIARRTPREAAPSAPA